MKTASPTVWGLRHARSLANEWMARPGNEWGSPTFRDDSSLVDARILQDESPSPLELPIDRILVSPLTRCLQTWEATGLTNVPVLAHPLLTERVYTASDTGRSVAELKQEFPDVDFSLVEDEWWYTGSDHDDEWRPHGEDQWYAVPGEPEAVFDARMERLKEYLSAQDDRLLLVTHWGVLRALTGNDDIPHAQVLRLL